LRPLYRLVLAQESGEWETVAQLARELHLSETAVAEKYWEATKWAQEVSGG